MVQDLLVVLGSILMLFLLMSVGFILCKLKKLSQKTLSEISVLVVNVGCPAVIVNTFLNLEYSAEEMHRLLMISGAIAATYVVTILISMFLYPHSDEATKNIKKFAAIYGNCGFMGIPLITSIFGAEGAFIAVITVVIFNIFNMSHGLYLICGKGNIRITKVLINPAIIGVAIGLFFYLLQIKPPAFFATTVNYINNIYSPLAMIIIGGQMASMKLIELFKDATIYSVIAIKLILMPAITFVMLAPLHLGEVVLLTLTIQAACPCAGATSLFCTMVGRDATYAGKLVTVSTILSLITLPLVAMVARMVYQII